MRFRASIAAWIQLQAAILRVKLGYLEEWNARRAAIALQYKQALGSCDMTLPETRGWAVPVWHLYVVRSPHRDALQKALTRAGVGTLIHYPIPPHLQGSYRQSGWTKGAFPIAESMAEQCLSLPMGPHLNSKRVAAVISAVLETREK